MSIWIIISYLILSLLCIWFVVRMYGKQKKQYANSILSTYIFFSLVFIAIWSLKLTVPSYVIGFSMLAVFFTCFFGYYLEYYLRSKTFDRFLHAFGSFSFAQLSFCILDDFIDTNSSKIFRSTFIFLLGNTLGIIIELAEANLDKKANIKNQRGLKDTNMDLLSDMIGSILASIVAYFWLF
ncbi:MAG: hypothetical protein PHY47_05680 [Lachnospiraceae bacterium]|nr:hypothetical protein [Lachnospiraceae bacterium]